LLGAEIRAAGQVPFDQSVSTAVEAGIPLMVAAPGSQAAREVRSLAEKIFPRSKAAGSQRAQNSGLPRK